ncbi:hypothetical protein SK128_025330, partial [Halocaridina rubra]
VALPIEDVLSQGFGGVPQPPVSGVSGSEVSSCYSSPTSSPSSASPLYMSVPTSPEKATGESPILMNAPMNILNSNAKISGNILATGDKISSSLTTSPEIVTPTSSPEPILSVRTRSGFSSASVDKDTTPSRLHKGPYRGNKLLMIAAGSSTMVKRKTAFLNITSSSYSSKCISEILNQCHELALLKSCEHLLTREITQAEMHIICDCDMVDLYSQLRLLDIDIRNYILKAIGSICDLIKDVSSKLQNGAALLHMPIFSCSAKSLEKWNLSILGAKYAINCLKLERVLCINMGTLHTPFHLCSSSILDMAFCSAQKQENISNGCDKCNLRYVIRVNNSLSQYEDLLALYHQILLPVAFEFSPQLIIIFLSYEKETLGEISLPAAYASLLRLIQGLAGGRIVVLNGVFDGNRTPIEGVPAVLSALQDVPCNFPLTSFLSPSLYVKSEILRLMALRKNNWKSLELHALSSSFSSKSSDIKLEYADVKSRTVSQEGAKLGEYI